ncbi:site-2 protease family protein [Campylobacter curvus]|uniref:site-2 protease family protein n=1 Tax=Campylobacter curvus TaxID=200 RepID=UPI001470518C|nr:site-2 protease family protein [Campylobacter curvus]
MDFTDFDATKILIIAASLVIAIVGHEIAHGFVAYKFGDTTAKNLDRLSINPIRHIDPLGTIVIPSVMYMATGLMFGWAKPVPVNMNTVIKNGGYKGAIAVALAGILYNLILTALTFLAFKFVKIAMPSEISMQFLYTLLALNLILAVFNLYPIPPLDGSKALEYILRILGLGALADRFAGLQRYGFIALVIILVSPFKEQFFYPVGYALDLMNSLL